MLSKHIEILMDSDQLRDLEYLEANIELQLTGCNVKGLGTILDNFALNTKKTQSLVESSQSVAVSYLAVNNVDPLDILTGQVKRIKGVEPQAFLGLINVLCSIMDQKHVADVQLNGKPSIEYHEYTSNYIAFLMEHGVHSFVMLGLKYFLTIRKLPINPKHCPAFDQFAEKYRNCLMC